MFIAFFLTLIIVLKKSGQEIVKGIREYIAANKKFFITLLGIQAFTGIVQFYTYSKLISATHIINKELPDLYKKYNAKKPHAEFDVNVQKLKENIKENLDKIEEKTMDFLFEGSQRG